jgi:phosphoglycolate phosphatase-like HAD superfamily hydrolase
MGKLVIFDLDGTLLCTHRHLYYAINRALASISLPPVAQETILHPAVL